MSDLSFLDKFYGKVRVLRVAFLLMYVYCCFRHAQWLLHILLCFGEATQSECGTIY